MYAALLALVSVAGSLIAWQRHPLHGSISTFRVLVETLLVVLGGGCAVYAALRFTQDKSATVQGIAIAVVVILVALTMIFSISAITTPKSAKLATALPPTAIVINMFRRRVTHYLKATLICLAFIAAACLVPGPVRIIAACMLGLALLLGSIMLPVAYVMARKFDRAATALTLKPWLHWHYQSDEWLTWKKVSVERLKMQPGTFIAKRDWRRILLVCAGSLTATLLLTPGGWGSRMLWSAACIALVMLIVELAAWDARRAPEKLKSRLDASQPDTYFGDDGMICDGLFFTWLGVDVYLTAASVDAREPRSVLMEFDKIVPSGYGAPNVTKLRQGVLIPGSAKSSELSTLGTALRSRCPTASISL